MGSRSQPESGASESRSVHLRRASSGGRVERAARIRLDQQDCITGEAKSNGFDTKHLIKELESQFKICDH